ncbi:LLM class flavin-dependent oxidoreductase [Streptomyces sp. NPDC001401]|uniref:LLM class flavin-dependent oxidoreductase n=1 Tax=Streptomyces sp. NPDC001401 TaxID=3364570 RepID=UPI0036A9B895
MRVSWLYPAQVSNPAVLLPFARTAQSLGVHRLWTGQSLRAETHQIFSYLCGAGIRMPMGSAVTLFPLRHPIDAAAQARGVAMLSGHSYVAGYGPGSAGFQAAALGEKLAKPASATVEFLTLARRFTAGEAVTHRGDLHRVDFQLEPLPHPPVHWAAGVLRPGMARRVAGCADLAITWMTPPAYVRDHIIPALTEGATAAARPIPEVATVVHVYPDRYGKDVYEVAQKAAGVHLSMPHYTDMLRRAGVAAHADDPRAGARALVDSGTFVHGSPRQIADLLEEYRRCGVAEVVLNPMSSIAAHGLGTAIRDLSDITTSLAAN